MNIGRRKKQEVLAASDNSVEILVVVFVERGLRKMAANPEVDSLRKAAEGFRGPVDVGVTVRSQGRVLRPKAIILLLRISHSFRLHFLAVAGSVDEAESFMEWHALNMS